MVGSLYSRELKALRANPHLLICLHINGFVAKGKIDSEAMARLRRWAEGRAKGLDRLAWAYQVVLPASFYTLNDEAVAWEVRKQSVKWEILVDLHKEAIGQLQRDVHEGLEWEIEPVYEELLKAGAVVTGEAR